MFGTAPGTGKAAYKPAAVTFLVACPAALAVHVQHFLGICRPSSFLLGTQTDDSLVPGTSWGTDRNTTVPTAASQRRLLLKHKSCPAGLRHEAAAPAVVLRVHETIAWLPPSCWAELGSLHVLPSPPSSLLEAPDTCRAWSLASCRSLLRSHLSREISDTVYNSESCSVSLLFLPVALSCFVAPT